MIHYKTHRPDSMWSTLELAESLGWIDENIEPWTPEAADATEASAEDWLKDHDYLILPMEGDALRIALPGVHSQVCDMGPCEGQRYPTPRPRGAYPTATGRVRVAIRYRERRGRTAGRIANAVRDDVRVAANQAPNL